MSGFLSRLKLNYVDGTSWEVAEEFCYKVEAHDSKWVVVVPKGTLTDFASIPRFIRVFMPNRWKYSTGSVIHDYLYRYGDKSKEISDAIFLEAQIAEGLSPAGAHILTLAVTLFGHHAYSKGRKYAKSQRRKELNHEE